MAEDSAVSFSEYSATVRFDDDHFPRRALQNLTVSAAHRTDATKPGATLTAKVINRDCCQCRLFAVCDEYSQELRDFAVRLFDKHGNVRPWLVNNEFHRGSGCWGTDLSRGRIVYVFDIEANTDGLKGWVFEQLLGSHNIREDDIIISWPSPSSAVRDKALWKRARDDSVEFYRELGFRRIGRTQFFAYSRDPSHPSRTLPKADDAEGETYQPPAPAAEDADAEPINPFDRAAVHERQQRDAERRAARYPLHSAVATTLKDEAGAVARAIDAVLAATPDAVHQQDDSGVTPIYLAVGLGSLAAARVLLGRGGTADLARRDNADGLSAVEMNAREMRNTREFSETVLGAWAGHEESRLKMHYLLKSALGTLKADETGEAEFVQKRKMGCTCGQCFGGWLSPRMRFRLETQAHLTHDNAMTMTSDFRDASWKDHLESDPSSDYIPPQIRQNVAKTYYQGYMALFDLFGHSLNPGSGVINGNLGAGTTWTAKIVEFARRTAPWVEGRSLDTYLSRGGRVEHVVASVIASARAQSALGDGTFDEMWDGFAEESGPGEVGAVWGDAPRCANDVEFELVKLQLGLDPRGQWGPYGEDELDDGLDDEDDDLDDDDDSD